MQIAKLAQHDLPPGGWQALPLGHQRLANVAALLRRHFLENTFALHQGLPLPRRKIIPVLKPLPYLCLLFRGQAAETRVIIQKFFLFRGRHLAQALHPAGRQVFPRRGIGPRCGRPRRRTFHSRRAVFLRKDIHRGRAKRRCQYRHSEFSECTHEPGFFSSPQTYI